LKNFTYVFSTGNHIDSLSIAGSVTNTLTQEKEKDVTVMIFPVKQDTLFGKKKPSIFATTDSSGNFSLNNLHDQDYYIYALKEASPNKIFDNEANELIAFLKQPIHLRSDTSNVQLNLFKQLPQKFRVAEKKFDTDGKMSFVFNKALNNPGIKVIYPADVDKQKQLEFSKTKDTASMYVRNMSFDSIRVAIYDNGKPIDSVSLTKGKKESFQRTLTFKYNINGNNLLKPGNDLKLTASLPIENFDNGQITLNEDSIPVAQSDYTLQKDTGNFKNFNLKYRWRQGSKYELIINEAAFTSIYGEKNKRLSKRFQVDKAENYSTLTIKVTVPDTAKAYVVELLSDNGEKKDILQSNYIRRNTSLVYRNYLTGKYMIRVVYDENRNGKWDSGNVKQRRQPENIWVSDKVIALRPNWEAEESITIPKERITP
jgi:hypothetical protein